ncbi:MAG: MarR family transcriptional regulator [Gemmatimonadales bacterium]
MSRHGAPLVVATIDVTQCARRLRGVVTLLARRLRPVLQQDGIGSATLSVVGQLYRGGPMTPTALAAREGVKLASLTRLLAELEGDRWISRRAYPEDGRQSILDLTELGKRRLMRSVNAANVQLAHALTEAVSNDEWEVLIQACAILERVNDVLSEIPRPEPATNSA